MEKALARKTDIASSGQKKATTVTPRDCSNVSDISQRERALIRLHSLVHGSGVNGPGLRSVVWVQGCSIRCPGCFNPETHPFNGGALWPVSDLAEELANAATEGLTLSGGEPTDQIAALIELLRLYRRFCDRTVLLYSGRTHEEIKTLPQGPVLLQLIDAAILGRYHSAQPEPTCTWGSSNQRICLLTGRLRMPDFLGRNTEILISPDGTCTITGYPAARFVHIMKRYGRHTAPARSGGLDK